MREVTIILSHALETWDLVLSWVYHFCYFFHCFVLLLQVWSLVRAQTVSIILLVFCWALGYLVVICLVQCWNTRHYKPCRTEGMFICSTTVLSTWYLIICKITGTPTKYTSVKTKLKNPQLKALNTEKLFLWRNRVFCFITLTFGKFKIGKGSMWPGNVPGQQLKRSLKYSLAIYHCNLVWRTWTKSVSGHMCF